MPKSKSKYVIPIEYTRAPRLQIAGFTDGQAQIDKSSVQDNSFSNNDTWNIISDPDLQTPTQAYAPTYFDGGEGGLPQDDTTDTDSPAIFDDIAQYARQVGDPDAFAAVDNQDQPSYLRSSLSFDNNNSDNPDNNNPDFNTTADETNFNPDGPQWPGSFPAHSIDDFSGGIVANESGGNYRTLNSSPGSTATGKYQFIYRIWGDEIARVTGVGSQEEFRNNPGAQEEFYNYYKEHYLQPFVRSRLSRAQAVDPSITAGQLAKMYHYGGAGNVDKAIASKSFDWIPGKGNSKTLRQYAGRQLGGSASELGSESYNEDIPVAYSPEDLYNGLNDPSAAQREEMILSQGGIVRGLDNHQPVYVTNGHQSRILIGPEDMIRMSPTKPVYERILKP